jgi:cytoskeletal protein CcmA (bactofilin family)
MRNSSKNISIIDKGEEFSGTIACKGRLVINGKLKAENLTGETVIVSEDGVLLAKTADVNSLTLGGRFEGIVKASEQLVILSTGRCSGKVYCKTLVIEPGGILNADVISYALQDEFSAGQKQLVR